MFISRRSSQFSRIKEKPDLNLMKLVSFGAQMSLVNLESQFSVEYLLTFRVMKKLRLLEKLDAEKAHYFKQY
jgi:hypothetical protein